MSTHEAPVTQTDRDTQKHSRSATRGWWVAEFVDDPDEVVVGIETDRGLWVHALAATGYQLYAINPLAVARSQDRHNVAGAKSYAGDTKVLADLVRTDRHNRRPIAGDSDDVEAIKVLGPRQSDLIWGRTRHTNQLRNAPETKTLPNTCSSVGGATRTLNPPTPATGQFQAAA